MAYLCFIKAFDSVCVRYFPPEVSWARSIHMSCIKEWSDSIIPIWMTSPGSLQPIPHRHTERFLLWTLCIEIFFFFYHHLDEDKKNMECKLLSDLKLGGIMNTLVDDKVSERSEWLRQWTWSLLRSFFVTLSIRQSSLVARNGTRCWD